MKSLVIFGAQTSTLEKEEIDGGTKHFGAIEEHVLDDGMRYTKQYSVLHRGTGAEVAIVRTRKAALNLMAHLEALPVDWAFRKRESAKYEAARRSLAVLPKAQRRKLKAVYSAAQEMK